MYSFSKRSKEQLETLHIDLQTLLNEVIKIFDISIIEGYRSLKRQQELFNSKPPKTKIDGVTIIGKHNHKPSLAADIVPYKKNINPFDNNNRNLARFYYMMGIVKAIASRLKREGKMIHSIRFGLDWNGNEIFTDQSFHDLPHVELIKPEISFGSSKS